MIKSSLKIADYRKVLSFQSILRVAELVRGIKAKHPKVTEEEIKAIFDDIYSPEIIEQGIQRAKNYISFKKRK